MTTVSHFSGDTKRDQWHEMSYLRSPKRFLRLSLKPTFQKGIIHLVRTQNIP